MCRCGARLSEFAPSSPGVGESSCSGTARLLQLFFLRANSFLCSMLHEPRASTSRRAKASFDLVPPSTNMFLSSACSAASAALPEMQQAGRCHAKPGRVQTRRVGEWQHRDLERRGCAESQHSHIAAKKRSFSLSNSACSAASAVSPEMRPSCSCTTYVIQVSQISKF